MFVKQAHETTVCFRHSRESAVAFQPRKLLVGWSTASDVRRQEDESSQRSNEAEKGR
jgi:hypothetical protein